MCQIIFSPDSDLCSQADFWEANNDNNDGIGVMSAMGVQKFFGKRQVRRAWAYVRTLADNKLAWAAHFRYATAGLRNRDNVHPFTSDAGVYWMHNGVLRHACMYEKERSDTAVLVQDYLGAITDPSKATDLVELAIGLGNKMLAYAPALDSWTIFNEQLGEWDNGIWFSNEYSRANWAMKYSGGLGSRESVSGYLYDGERHELTEIHSDGSRGRSIPAVNNVVDGYVGGTTSTGKQIAVIGDDSSRNSASTRLGGQLTPRQQAVLAADEIAREAACSVGVQERMALVQPRERLADCVTCASLELKKCLCSVRGDEPATEIDIDMALDALDRRLANDCERNECGDAMDRPITTLTDPAAIQERIDAYLAEEADERSLLNESALGSNA